jgi:hypothetical protein
MFRIIYLAVMSVRWDLLICKVRLLFRIRGYDDCLRCRKELISLFVEDFVLNGKKYQVPIFLCSMYIIVAV